jgi:hypothetical protein
LARKGKPLQEVPPIQLDHPSQTDQALATDLGLWMAVPLPGMLQNLELIYIQLTGRLIIKTRSRIWPGMVLRTVLRTISERLRVIL